MAIEKTVNKWAVLIVGVLILGVFGAALMPLVFSQFSTTGGFSNATCTSSNTTMPGFPADNTSVFYCISNTYSPFFGAIPTITAVVFIGFILSLIVGVGFLQYGKHR